MRTRTSSSQTWHLILESYILAKIHSMCVQIFVLFTWIVQNSKLERERKCLNVQDSRRKSVILESISFTNRKMSVLKIQSYSEFQTQFTMTSYIADRLEADISERILISVVAALVTSHMK